MNYQPTAMQQNPYSLGVIQKAVLSLDIDKHPAGFKRASSNTLTEAKYTQLLNERCTKIATSLAVFRTSQLALYEQLADAILKPYTEYEALSSTERRIVELAVDKFLELTGSKTRKESNMLFKMTKAVVYGPTFKNLSDPEKDRLRRQCSSYASVVAAAYAAEVVPGDLPAWIAEKHGIERIRLGNSKYVQENDARIGALPAVTSRFLSDIQHTFETADSFNLNADSEGKQVLLFATYRMGNIEIHGVTTNDKVFNAACRSHLLLNQPVADDGTQTDNLQSN